MLRLCPAPAVARLSELLAADIDRVIASMEPGTPAAAARTWVIDPIDGTRAFVAGGASEVGPRPTRRVVGRRGSPVPADGARTAQRRRRVGSAPVSARQLQCPRGATSDREPPNARPLARDRRGRISLAGRQSDYERCPQSTRSVHPGCERRERRAGQRSARLHLAPCPGATLLAWPSSKQPGTGAPSQRARARLLPHDSDGGQWAGRLERTLPRRICGFARPHPRGGPPCAAH